MALWLEGKFTDRKVRGSNPTSAYRLPCLGLGNLAVSQLLCFLQVVLQLGTERVPRQNDLLIFRASDDQGQRFPLTKNTNFTVTDYWTGEQNSHVHFVYKTEYPSSPSARLPELSWIFVDCYSDASKCYKRLHKYRNRSHFSRDAKRIYEKTYYSHASSVASTVTMVSCI
ncbi:hypothetical protein CSKR_104503 [Clonorchis sinensis]|uniref:Uncharacterized protein n=1 Tax=Clonorchis sinensis TaxID=79923 RepID=A0A419Q614_CLOSI|nr:hypothetical protein CSKR_104503 [Clonorchis sinensis]